MIFHLSDNIESHLSIFVSRMMSYEKSIKDMSEKINSLTEVNRELTWSIADKNINLEKKNKNMDAGASGFVKKINLVEKWKHNEFKNVFGKVMDL